MLTSVAGEATKRLGTNRALLRTAHRREIHNERGDEVSRCTKGMLFVQNYAVYEHVVTECVRQLIVTVNSRQISLDCARKEILCMALDSELSSIAGGSQKKKWEARTTLFKKARSADTLRISENLFPKDGSQYRPPQLETIWSIFGLPGEIVSKPSLRGHIVEMVDTRNRIAHGSDAPDAVGGRFTTSDLGKRIDDTEDVCVHLLVTIGAHCRDASSFQ